jgi:tetratricopeptide (TPR) repeat protein
MTNTIDEIIEGITDDRIKERAIREICRSGTKLSDDLVESYLTSDLQLRDERLDLAGQIPERPIAKKILAEYVVKATKQITENSANFLSADFRKAGFTKEADVLDTQVLEINLNTLNEKVKEVDQKLYEGFYQGDYSALEKATSTISDSAFNAAESFVNMGQKDEARWVLDNTFDYVWKIMETCNLEEASEYGLQFWSGENRDFKESKTKVKERLKESLAFSFKHFGLQDGERKINGEIGRDYLQKCAQWSDEVNRIHTTYHRGSDLWKIKEGIQTKLSKAAEYLERSDDSNALNDCYRQIMVFKEKVGHFQDALEYAEKLGDSEKVVELENAIATSLARQGNFAKAAKYALRAGLTNQAEAYQKIDELCPNKEK